MQHQLNEYRDVQFGTSGVRGLVTAMTDVACYAYAKAFVQYYTQREHIAVDALLNDSAKRYIAVSGDLRRSTSRIIRAVYRAIFDMGFVPLDCGRFPTPTLALFAMTRNIPGIMVTGSHIPDDRNGIKFFLPEGEITKRDELHIRTQQVEIPDDMFLDDGQLNEWLYPKWVETDRGDAAQMYYMRYTDTFSPGIFDGMRIGLYEHSAVGRELIGDLFESFGAQVMRLGRTMDFVPVDTESLSPDVEQKVAHWAASCELDAIFSTDGDSDRPLVFDENGQWLNGDIIATLTAMLLEADTVVVPITTSGLLEQSNRYVNIIRTKVGSPYVVEAMRQAVEAGHNRVVGFEPNGGFMLATPFDMAPLARRLQLPEPASACLSSLPTRDPVIVLIAVLAASKLHQMPLSELPRLLPPCCKLSDRIPDYANEISSQMLRQLAVCEGTTYPFIERIFGQLGPIRNVNLLDGVRMHFENGEIVHLRASGNAPEFRCYVEAASLERSRELLELSLAKMSAFREQLF